MSKEWFERRTYRDEVDAAKLAEIARDTTISVVLPARNEESTVGSIVTSLRDELVDRHPLIDEIIVVDSQSTDDTAAIAADAGAHIVAVSDAGAPDGGKGSALREGVAAMRGELGVFLDADVTEFDPSFVTRLVAPLLDDPGLVFVKGFYDRPWTGSADGAVGGRVTELVARPLLQRRAPDLAAFAQPLAGECAFQRSALTDIPFVSGYGVDIGLLVTLAQSYGVDALGQVDLGVRRHSHQDLAALGRMAFHVEAAVELCLSEAEVIDQIRTVIERDDAGVAQLREEQIVTRLLPPIL